MTKVTYYKPNRTSPRYFTPCDVARCARNCRDDREISEENILSCVAKGFGMEAIALPTADRQLPAGVDDLVDKVSRLIDKVEESLSFVTDALDKVDSVLSSVLDKLPDFVTDDEQTEEDKLLLRFVRRGNRVFVNAKKRLLAAVKVADIVRDRAREFSQDVKELKATLNKASELIKTAKDISNLKIITLQKVNNCKCKEISKGSRWFKTPVNDMWVLVDWDIKNDVVISANIDRKTISKNKPIDKVEESLIQMPDIINSALLALTVDYWETVYRATTFGQTALIIPVL